MDEEYLELLHRVRLVLNDTMGMDQNEAEEMIDDLRDAGIGFKEISDE